MLGPSKFSGGFFRRLGSAAGRQSVGMYTLLGRAEEVVSRYEKGFKRVPEFRVACCLTSL